MRVVVNGSNEVSVFLTDAEIKSVCDAANKVVEQAPKIQNAAQFGTLKMTEEEHYNAAVQNICGVIGNELAQECYFEIES